MQKLLSTDKNTFEMTEFESIIKETDQQFYKAYNDFCITHGPTDNEVFAVMKDDIKINNFDHVVVKLNLNDGTITKFTRDHDKYIYSLLYNSAKDILITGGKDQSIYIYNCKTTELIHQTIVGKGSIHSLILKSNVLFVGASRRVSVYELCIDNDINNNNDSFINICEVNRIKHIELSPREDKVWLRTFVECGQFDFWLSGCNSNKIYNMSIDKEHISNIICKLAVILRQSYNKIIRFRRKN